MHLTFFLKFHTRFGQQLFVVGDSRYLGSNVLSNAVALSYHNEEFWKAEVEIPADFGDTIYYRYVLSDTDGMKIFDAEEGRFLEIPLSRKRNITVYDSWNAASNEGNVFFTSAFNKVLLPPSGEGKLKSPKDYNYEFRVKAPLLNENETICLIGSTTHLTAWNENNPIILTQKNNWYVARIKMNDNEWPASYKYGIYNLKEKIILHYENGENRQLERTENVQGITIIQDGFVNYNKNTWKGAGVNIPVFSLRSKDSFGVGDFLDLKLLVDWARKTGLQLIQLLPVNDTTVHNDKRDSYPYASMSAFALHPLYIHLESVAGKEADAILAPLREQQNLLNALPEYDYDQVWKLKMSVLKQLYEIKKADFKEDVNFFQFFDLNREWLVPYAVFSYLREKNKTSDFTRWKTHSKYNESTVQSLASSERPHYDEIAFYYFVQYHLHLQLKEVTNYAHENKIILKGDIPIGVYRFGCDAWQNYELFNMDQQAGAPPDDFAVKGQNWGFPTYNWEKMAEDHFSWWRKRFDQMSIYYDAFRIDHILGFFRIWSVPYSATEAILGKFVPAIPVDISEFEQNNIWFEHDRYCKPFINDDLLNALFNERAEEIKSSYLDAKDNGLYQLKEEVNTQRKVENKLTSSEDSSMKQGLLDLLSNVILLEEEKSDGRKFHFAISMAGTYSFSQLDDHTRRQLSELYKNYFYRRQDDFWKVKGLEKLAPLKRSTNMLVFGEDLGMVPDCVPEVMSRLEILSLEVQRMPKAMNQQFFHPAEAPYLSDVMPSTHDMSTIRGWWKEDRGVTQQFYNKMLGHYGEAPVDCEPWINREVVVQNLFSPAMWCIFLWQDLMGMDGKLRRKNPDEERINVPADPNHFWGYRMHLNLEDLIQEEGFNEDLKKMIEGSGR